MPGSGLASKFDGLAFRDMILGIESPHLSQTLLVMVAIGAVSSLALYLLLKDGDKNNND